MKMTTRIYKRSMAAFLIDYGCNFIKVVSDVAYPDKMNWLFEDNALLREGMTVYTEQLHR